MITSGGRTTLSETPAEPTAADDALRHVQRLVNGVFAAIMVVLAVVAIGIMSLRYIEAVGESRRQVGVLSDLLSEYLVIRLRGVDGVLSRIAADNRRIGGPEGSEREWASALRSAIAGVSGLSSLVVLDVDGTVRHATVQQIVGLSWAERPIFQELARGVPNMVVVDPPITMVTGSQVLIPFGRALNDPRGNFIGVIIALLVPDQLRDFLEAFDLGPTGIAWVLLPSGEVLFKDGAIDAVNDEETPLFTLDSLEGVGYASGPLVSGGDSYVTAYRRTAFANLTVAVSIADARALSRWRTEAIIAAMFVVAFAALLYLAARRIKSAALDILAAGDLDAALDNPL